MDPLGSPSKVTCSMCKPHELIPSSYCERSMHSKFYLGLASQGEKMAEMAVWLNQGRDSEGQSWIVHEKWPVHCANLMSSFLLVIEIHAIKVLPRIHLRLCPTPISFFLKVCMYKWDSHLPS